MPENQDKTVGIKFSLDQSSLDRAREGIQSLIDDVEKLVDMTGKVSFGGLGGMGAKVGSFSGGSSGRGNVGTQMSQKVSSAGGGVVDGLARAVTASSSLFKGASAGAVGSFKIMQDSLRQMVSRSEGEISRLEGSLSKLEKTFTKLKGQQRAGISGPGMDAVLGQNQAQYFAQVGQLGEANAARSAMLGNLRKMNPTMGDRVGGFFGVPAGGYAPGTSPMTMLMGAAGSPAGMISGGAGLAYKALNLAGQFGSGNLGYALDSPMIELQNKANIGGMWGGMALRARQGAVSQTMGWDKFLKEQKLGEIMGKTAAENFVQQIRVDNPAGLSESAQRGKGILDATLQGVGKGLSTAKRWIHGGDAVSNAGNLTGQEILQSKAFKQLPSEMQQRIQQGVAAEEASNPYINQVANDVYSTAFSEIAGINASRTSGNVIFDKKTGKPINTDYDLVKSKLQQRGWDPGQIFGAMSGLSSQLGRRLSGTGVATQITDMGIGGFESAAGVYSAGSQFGLGAAGGNSLTGAFQGLTGRGFGKQNALDISAGSSIGKMVAQQMTGGTWAGSSGEEFAKIALNAAYAGGETGTEMRNARMLPSGLESLNRVASGSLDPLQTAINMSAADQVAGNLPWATRQKLMSLSDESLMDIAKGKKPLPLSLAGTEVTRELIQQYVKTRNYGDLARTGGQLTNEEQAENDAYNAAGGVGYLKKFKSGIERERHINILANARQVGNGESFEANYGAIRLKASAEGLLGGVRGHGAHRTISSKSLPFAGAKATGKNTGLTGKTKAENEIPIKDAMGRTPDMAEPLQQTGQSMVRALGGQAEAKIVEAKEALNTALNIMIEMTKIETPAGAEKSAKAYYGGAGRAKKPSPRVEMNTIPAMD